MTRWSIHLSASACPLISQCSRNVFPAPQPEPPLSRRINFFALAPLLECVSLFLYVSSPFNGPPRDPLLRRKSRSRASHGKVPSPLMQYKVSGWYRKARECGKWSTGSRKAHVYSEKDVYLQSCSTPLPGCRLQYGPKEYTRRELIRSSQPIVLFSWLWKYSAEQIICSRPVRTWYQKASPVAGFYIMKSLCHAPYSDVLSPRHHTFPFNSTLSWNNFNVGEGVLYLYPCLHSCNG